MADDRGRHEPVFYISVAARLLEVHPQTLRAYERLGFLRPARTGRGQRLYSEADLERVRQVRRLTEEMGVNLAGVEIILNLLERLEHLQAEIERLNEQVEHGPRPLSAGEPRRIEIHLIGEKPTQD